MTGIEAFVRGLPKTDLHMHIEGCIEPQLMLDFAARNGLKLRWDTAEALRGAYRFQNLQSFLDLYFEGCKVLITELGFGQLASRWRWCRPDGAGGEATDRLAWKVPAKGRPPCYACQPASPP
jgi:adenosine deaminase